MDAMQVRIANFIRGNGRPREMSEKAQDLLRDVESLRDQAVEVAEEETRLDIVSTGALQASVRVRVMTQLSDRPDITFAVLQTVE